ncbi:VOC family protein [Aeromicrobium ginsengisoli]|uniref:VOC family protein n=1 Tax=Aeromicrobium ginsengisoli TaxID=363867 RepID=A0A5M4FGU4_9ACTN|nr:VOC family protein [Aeromicrobium ginsengisoli]KAA1399384.1 VOC family protein [Aeromicrobium ginsengisoli]
MVTYGTPFSGFSVSDVPAAKAFYADVIGLDVEESEGMLHLALGDGHHVLVYPKGEAHVPASFTVLNLPVEDVSAAVRELSERGVSFKRYEGMPQDDDGVMKGNGPDIAWFTDPSGNVVSVIGAPGPGR